MTPSDSMTQIQGQPGECRQLEGDPRGRAHVPSRRLALQLEGIGEHRHRAGQSMEADRRSRTARARASSGPCARRTVGGPAGRARPGRSGAVADSRRSDRSAEWPHLAATGPRPIRPRRGRPTAGGSSGRIPPGRRAPWAQIASPRGPSLVGPGDEAERFGRALRQAGEERLDSVAAAAMVGMLQHGETPTGIDEGRPDHLSGGVESAILKPGDGDDVEILGHATRPERRRRQDPESGAELIEVLGQDRGAELLPGECLGIDDRPAPADHQAMARRPLRPLDAATGPPPVAASDAPFTRAVCASLAKSRGGSVAPSAGSANSRPAATIVPVSTSCR